MKRIFSLTLLLVLLILAFHGIAQVRPDRRLGEMREEKQNAARRMMLIDKQVITLLQARKAHDRLFASMAAENRNMAFVEIASGSTKRPASFRNAKLRIDMNDGSVQEIPLYKINAVVIEQAGDIR